MSEPDIVTLHRRALQSTRVVVGGLDPTLWEARTPCEEWTLRELLNHVIAGNWWAARLASGASIADVGTDLDGDQIGDDPGSSYDASGDAAARAFEAPGALEIPADADAETRLLMTLGRRPLLTS